MVGFLPVLVAYGETEKPGTLDGSRCHEGRKKPS